MEARGVWHYSDTGTGRPLILLHGIGMSHAAWRTVIPYLSPTRRVVAFDTAGFGSTPSLPRGTLPTLAHLVDHLERSICQMGIELPVDFAGNSLGASMALEAARRGIARTVVAISPAGLWRDHGALHVSMLFSGLRFAAAHFPGALRAAMRPGWMRGLALAVPISVGSRRMPVSDAIRAVDDLASATAFEETFSNTRAPLSALDIDVPVTVVFGDRDWILTKGSRRREALPAHTRWIEKRRWGRCADVD